MAVSLYDHERRIQDLEAAVEALRRLFVDGGAQSTAALVECARKLRVNGRPGAAAILEGAPRSAAYQR